MGYFKYLFLETTHKIERLKDSAKAKKLEFQLGRFSGSPCIVRQGEFNEETQEFEVLKEEEVSDLRTKSLLAVTDLLDGDEYLRFSLIIEEVQKIHLGKEGVVFTQDGYGRDILITKD